MAEKTFTFPVDRTAIMLFARSVLDIRPEFTDPDAPETKALGGMVAPPTFTWASSHYEPDYALDLTRPRKEPRQSAPSMAGGGGGLGRGLHGEQHYEYFHPIYAGDELTVTIGPGETWTKEGRRGGKLTFSEQIYDYTNQDGVLCVRARMIGVQTEKAVEQ
ncbi:MAG: MaoC family dehydratase N-terminal domain-containing protein [Dehalococcoidia bacterium]|nr:MaoC family dehydratase N-terminal domain-containing protein [Dehalococcoidia bacterium]